MTSVFGHGRLRLYLLKLLDEEPRHGYDIIRSIQDRFMGVYAPSAGTIYPRLSRLEDEGLIEHDVVDGKKTYRLTDAGRAELAARSDELSALEEDIARSVRDLASEVREDVRSSVRDLREELKAAAREARDLERENARGDSWSGMDDVPGWDDAKEAMRAAQRAVKEGSRSWQGSWEWSGQWSSSRKRLVKDLLKDVELLRAEVRRAVKTSVDEANLAELRTTLQSTLAQAKDLSRR